VIADRQPNVGRRDAATISRLLIPVIEEAIANTLKQTQPNQGTKVHYDCLSGMEVKDCDFQCIALFNHIKLFTLVQINLRSLPPTRTSHLHWRFKTLRRVGPEEISRPKLHLCPSMKNSTVQL
jgi:hypothetical protein